MEKIEASWHKNICDSLCIDKCQKPKELAPLVLAFVGDAVFDLVVRTLLLEQHKTNVHQLHIEKAKRVRASAQAEAMQAILPILTTEETAIYRRGRNAKPGTIPKHASLADYAMATGLEALIGYLFMDNQQERMFTIIEQALEAQTIAKPVTVKPYKK